MATLNAQNGGRVLHLKGAFERVLPMCANELGAAENVNDAGVAVRVHITETHNIL
jgi:hypothetical protein